MICLYPKLRPTLTYELKPMIFIADLFMPHVPIQEALFELKERLFNENN